MRVVFSGGGTGGHIFPAISIADALKKKRPDAEILFIGAKDKIEMDRVPKAGYPIKGLWISGFHRKLTSRNLLFPFKLIHSLFKSFWIIRNYKPDVVVGVGGFASGPALEAAVWQNKPTLIQEQNSYPGVTNKLLAKKVNTICVAYSGMEKYFPKQKIVKTGNPVRAVIADLQVGKNEAKAFFELVLDKKTIVAFGGSLGARSLNVAIANSYELLKKHQEVELIWQVGKLYYDEYRNSEISKLPNVTVMPFIERMEMAYAAADLLITRAGALTISEICTVGKPAILVPSPNVAEDHQTKNALSLTEHNAAILIRDENIKDRLVKEALEYVHDEETLEIISASAKEMGISNAADIIADEVIRLGELKK